MSRLARGMAHVAVAAAVVVALVGVLKPFASTTASAAGPIAFRSASSGLNATAASLSIAKPAGVIAGDVMIATVAARGNPNLVAQAGWTLIRLDLAGFTVRNAAYYKIATASEPASYTWTWSGNQAAAGGILAFSGVDTAAPIDAHSGAASAANSTSIVAPSVTTTAAGSMIVGLFSTAANATIAQPPGMTEAHEAVSNAGTYPVVSEAAYQPQPAAGPSGNRVATASLTAQNVGQLVALKQASAPTPSPSPSPTTTTPPPPPGDPKIAASGDIACDPGSSKFNGGNGTATECRQKYTSDQLVGAGYAAVLPLGDNQYENGSLGSYNASYDPSWGRVKGQTFPVPGNHEYGTAGAAGYYDYFGAAAGDRTKGYYSYDVGAWHVIALNSNCIAVPCGIGSTQELWLRADLAAHQNACTLAYWHHPLFSSGSLEDGSSQAFWQALYDLKADVVLVGHDHIYERFAPQTPAGAADPTRGVRQFTAGMGGKDHFTIGSPAANSQIRDNTTFGILELTLHPASYDWRFVPEAGGTFSDTGSASCNGPPPSPNNAPTADPVSATTAEDTPTPLTLTGHDTETCELTFQIVSPPAHGAIGSLTPNGCSSGAPNTDTATAMYTPASNYNGPDGLTYRVTDGAGSSSTLATVSLTITPVADPPFANGDSYSTPPNQQLVVEPPGVLLNDGDPDGDSITAVSPTAPSHGSLTLNTNGSFTYTPEAGFSGSDSFTYRASDGLAMSPPATVAIAVSGATQPIAFRSSAYGTVGSGSALTIFKPPVVAAGDVMVASIDARGNPSFVAPPGWTLIRLDISGFVLRKASYYKVASASEPDFYTWTWTGNQAAAGGILAYANVDTSSPIAAHSGAASANASSASIRAPSVTPLPPGAMILGFYAMAQNAAIAPPPGMTERFVTAAFTGPYPETSEGAEMLQPTAGATGDQLATANRTGWSIGQLIVLRPLPPRP